MPRKTYNWAALEADYRAGMPLRELEAKYGANRGTISKKAKVEGWTKGSVTKPTRKRQDTATSKATKAKAKKATNKRQPGKRSRKKATHPRASVDPRVDRGQVAKKLAEKAILEDTLATLETHSRVAKNAAVVASEMITRAQDLVRTAGKGDSPMIHAAAALLDKGTKSLMNANIVFRKNRGLDDKTKTELSGTLDMRMSPEEWRRGRSEKPL
jgi:hypothetical protein